MYVLLLKAQYIMSTILTITAPSPLQSLCVHYVEHNFTQNCLISHQFFNNMLVVGNSSESELGLHLYTLIYELYAIDSSLLLSVLPQLEYKLTVRLSVTINYLDQLISAYGAQLTIPIQFCSCNCVVQY